MNALTITRRPRRRVIRTLPAACLTAAALVFAGFIAVDSLRAVVPLWSPLPWFDEWATVELLRAWHEGEMSAAEVLFAQHNEHRILVPRLVFFADDLLFRGGGYLSLAAIFAVQALHAGLFAAVIGRARPARPGRWAVAAAILATMFSLRQDENFSSGFQLQFVAVFAGATLSFVLFGIAAARERAGRPLAWPLAASLGAALLTAFTMANGLVVGYALAALALAARMRPRVALACAAWALLLTAVYLHGYEPVEHHARPSDALRHPLALVAYVATYLGSLVATDTGGRAAELGLFGLALTAWAGSRAAARGRRAAPGALAMLGVMLFVCATAAITASGRLNFGVGQALSGRYVTGSVAFWAAQLAHWWIDPPAWRIRARDAAAGGADVVGLAGRLAVIAGAAALCWSVAKQQGPAKLQLAVQSFAENESADALMLGLDDPAATARAAWSDEDVQRLLPTLKADRLSIFATADADGVGRPVAARGRLDGACEGGFASAEADPRLGLGGARASGSASASSGGRIVRRVILADAEGIVRGLASGAVPGAPRGAWRGYAVAPVGARLTAYGLLDGGRLCGLGSATVAPSAAAPIPAAPAASSTPQASQPEEAP